MTAPAADPIDYRLRVTEPFTLDAPKIVLPVPLTSTYSMREHGIPELTFQYAEGTTRADLLGKKEIIYEVKNYNDEWVEKRDCRFLIVSRSYDRKDRNRVVTYRCLGMHWILTRLKIYDATEVDPGDGPQPPLRIFEDPDAGDLLVPTFNAAIARAYEDIAVPFTDPPDKNYQLSLDSNGEAWAEIIPGIVSRRITEPVSNLFDLCVQTGIAEFYWDDRRIRAVNFGTLGQDLDDVILRDIHGVSSSPEIKDFQDLAARVLVTGDKGQIYVRENLTDADLSYGALEHATSVTADDPGALHKAARELMVLGESENEELGAKGVGDVAGPKPLRDYHVGDKIRKQRDGVAGSRFPLLKCVEFSITRQRGRKITWVAKFGDRHEDRLMRQIRRNNLLSAGETLTPGGRPADPSGDIRRPAEPTGVTVTTTNYPDENDKTRAEQTISWTLIDPWLDELGDPINLDGFEIGERRFGVTSSLARVGPLADEWTRTDVFPGARDLLVRAISHDYIPGPYADAEVGDVTRETEPKGGPNKVLDARFEMASINTARQNNAGSGFQFVVNSSRTRGEFSTTTPHLRSGIAGLTDSGRFQVEPGEVWNVGGTDKRVGSSAAAARYGVSWWNAAGTRTDVDNVVTHSCTTSDVRTIADWTVPSGAITAAWKAKATGTLTSTTVLIMDPIFQRKAATENVQDAAIVEAKVATDAISTTKVQNLAISNGKIGNGAVTGSAAGLTAKIASRTIGNTNIVVNSITAGEIAANTITAGQIAALTITAGEIATSAITTSKLADGSVETLKIASGVDVDGTITTSTGLTIGGISAGDITFPNGGKIGDNGGGGIIVQDFINLLGSGTYTGTWTPVSVRESKTAIKPITVDQARKLLELEPITFKHRDAWMRERTKRVIDARDVVDRATGKTRRRRRQVIPGHTDSRRYAGFIAEDVEAAEIEGTAAHDKTGKLIGADMLEMVPYLIRLIQDQDDRIAALEAAS